MPRYKGSQPREKKQMSMWPFYIMLVVLLISYAFDNNAIIGLGAFVLIIIIVAVELRTSLASVGAKRSAVDFGVAIGAAIAIWLILVIVLQTTSPIDAVASCSMLPNLQRGDFIVLHGISNFSSFASEHKIPVIKMDPGEFSQLRQNMQSEFLSYYAYIGNNKSEISQIIPVVSEPYGIALYNTKCLSTYSYLNQNQNIGRCYVGANPEQNIIKYNYSIGLIVQGKVSAKAPYTSSITINNLTISENYSNPIVVYKTTPSDLFGGDIIHRLVAVIDVNGSYYTLTKGDNNQGLDIQFENYPAQQGDIVGYVVGRIPIIGYLKLIISGQLAEPAGCNQVFVRT
ncbi:MAG: hypothetical protein KGH61_05055 [Candidatus Micrarchaeota archaeon]|nr:hypothetical protein [Candidatus Micrarchaeota archaeon]MDE1848283.1 hypothetical protein [Candidatus Micrarchaeota archaeon]MDE1864314.1 hypothetical protein [Candidatus Micrarchaeota archaeon]